MRNISCFHADLRNEEKIEAEANPLYYLEKCVPKSVINAQD